ncbi:hypothetical protein HKCCSP123_13905 [Rhodobacterales bacterium HKCCSP123]|nr:hypothetical protein [Rhodobacterales bacterium HKCCSP123]
MTVKDFFKPSLVLRRIWGRGRLCRLLVHWLVLLSWISVPGWAVGQVANPEERFEERLEENRAAFRFMDLSDLRAVRGQIEATRRAADTCYSGVCPEFDCAAAQETLTAMGSLHMYLGVLGAALDHQHELHVAHLQNLHNEALLAEEEAASAAEILFWQTSVIRISSLMIQVGLLFGDLDGLQELDDASLLSRIHLADEIMRDLVGVMQDSQALQASASPEFREATDDAALAAAVNTALTHKSNAANILDGFSAQHQLYLQRARAASPAELAILADERTRLREVTRANLVALAGRVVRDFGQAEVARRQAEVARLNTDAYRERMEATNFAKAVLGLGVQAELVHQLTRQSLEAFTALDRCVEATCPIALLNLPEVPDILVMPPPEDPVRRPRIDMAQMEFTVGRIIRLADTIRTEWVRPVCERPDQGLELVGPDGDADLEPAGPPALDAFAFSPAERAAHGCQNLLPELRESCFASFAAIRARNAEVSAIGLRGAALQPGTPAFEGWMGDLCVSLCGVQSSIDTALDRFRELAILHVARVDAAAQTRLAGQGGAEDPFLETQLDRYDATRADIARRFVDFYHDPLTDALVSVTGGTTPSTPGAVFVTRRIGTLTEDDQAALEEVQRAIRDLIAGRPPLPDPTPFVQPQSMSAWAEAATEFWSDYGDHQLLRCGGDTLLERRRACEFQCSLTPNSVNTYQMCSVEATRWSFDTAAQLYPPGDERREGVVALQVSVPP